MTTGWGGRGVRVGGWGEPEQLLHGQVAEGEYQDTQLEGVGGAFDSCVFATSHPTRTLKLYDDKIWKRTLGVKYRYTETRRDPKVANPPGDDKDLGGG